jgi:hypothetical protein
MVTLSQLMGVTRAHTRETVINRRCVTMRHRLAEWRQFPQMQNLVDRSGIGLEVPD